MIYYVDRINYYKCFKDRQVFPLFSVNLFTGLNGRGKSSVLQTILLMSQTVNNTNSLRELLVSSSWLKLGNFDDIRSSASDTKSIRFGFKSNLDKLDSFDFEYIEKEGIVDKGTLQEFSLNGESSEDTISASVTDDAQKEKTIK